MHVDQMLLILRKGKRTCEESVQYIKQLYSAIGGDM